MLSVIMSHSPKNLLCIVLHPTAGIDVLFNISAASVFAREAKRSPMKTAYYDPCLCFSFDGDLSAVEIIMAAKEEVKQSEDSSHW